MMDMNKVDSKKMDMFSIYDKLTELRNGFADCSQSLLHVIDDDKFFDKTLLENVITFSRQISIAQDELISALRDNNITPAETMEAVKESLEIWKQKEEEKKTTESIKAILLKVESLEYTGIETSIAQELDKIKAEAKTILADIKNYEEHIVRIQAMSALVEAASTEGVASFSTFKELSKSFNPEICYAASVTHELKLKSTVSVPQNEKTTADEINRRADRYLSSKQEESSKAVLHPSEAYEVFESDAGEKVVKTAKMPDGNSEKGETATDVSTQTNEELDVVYPEGYVAFDDDELSFSHNDNAKVISGSSKFASILRKNFVGFRQLAGGILTEAMKAKLLVPRCFYVPNFDTKQISAVAEKLFNKGLLDRCVVKGEIVYIASENLLNLAENESVKKMLDINSTSKFNIKVSESLIKARYRINQGIYFLQKSTKVAQSKEGNFAAGYGALFECILPKKMSCAIIGPVFSSAKYAETLHELENGFNELIKNGLKTMLVVIESEKEISTWNKLLSDDGFEQIAFLKVGKDGTAPVLLDAAGQTCTFDVLLPLPQGQSDEKEKAGGKPDQGKDNGENTTVKDMKRSDSVDLRKGEKETVVLAEQPTEKLEMIPIHQEKKPEAPTEGKPNLTGAKRQKKVAQQGKSETKTAQVQNATMDIKNELENDKGANESVQDMMTRVAGEFGKHHIAEGMLLMHGIQQKIKQPWADDFTAELSYALGDPLYPVISAGRDAFNYWDSPVRVPEMDSGNARDYLNCAAMVRCFFEPDLQNDSWRWQAEAKGKQINDSRDNVALQNLPSLKKIINHFRLFLKDNRQGLGSLSDEAENEGNALRNALQRLLTDISEQKKRIENNLKTNHNHLRIDGTYQALFGKESEISHCFNLLSENGVEELAAYCVKFTKLSLFQFMSLQPGKYADALDEGKLADYVNAAWDHSKVPHQKNERLIGSKAAALKNLLQSTLEKFGEFVLMEVKSAKMQAVDPISPDAARKQKESVKELCTSLLQEMDGLESENPLEEIGIFALRYLTKSLIKKFSSGYEEKPFYAPLLLTRFIELDGNFHPDISYNFGISGMSLYNRCVKHIEELDETGMNPDKECYEKARQKAKEIRNMGNYGLLCQLVECVDDSHSNLFKLANEKFLKQEISDFRSSLELAYNYGQIADKNRMDSYTELANRLSSHVNETENYGMFPLFKAACHERIAADSMPIRKQLETQFQALKRSLAEKFDDDEITPEKYPVLDQVQKCLDEGNFSVAEDYIRQCQDNNVIEITQMVVSYPSQFMTFIKEYTSYYDVCTRNNKLALNGIFQQWILRQSKSMGDLRKNRKGKEQIEFVNSWNKLISNGTAGLPGFLYHLGYPEPLEKDIERDRQNMNRTVYHVRFQRDDKTNEIRGNRHPFVQFGSGIYRNGLRIVTITSQQSPESIVNQLLDAGAKSDAGTICVYDGAMPLIERRKMASLMKMDENLRNIIVLDRVMALYLTQFEQSRRENITIELAMPFANAQPFIPSGFIPPEMFIGRSAELAKIRDMNGPTLVYGGRQLGKSILLKQVSYLEHHPEKGNFAFYFDVKRKDYGAALRVISNELKRQRLIQTEAENWDQFGEQMKDLLSDKLGVHINKLMLLIDEADQFLLTSADCENKPVEVLRDVRNYSGNRFKFVLAGLHNVIKFDKNRLGGNTVYGQLGHINIKPFAFAEACELLLKPLSYLGFQIPSMEIVSTILSKTNYFPGLIQSYGAKLVDSVKESYRKGDFTARNNPPYILDENYLKRLMEDKSFLEDIEEKFMITLKVDKDDDNYYYLIALAMAEQYVLKNGQPEHGFTPSDIKEIGEFEGISKITNMTSEALEALMDEMEELNIFRKDSEGRYIFNRYSFYSMMGGERKIESELDSYSDAAAD